MPAQPLPPCESLLNLDAAAAPNRRQLMRWAGVAGLGLGLLACGRRLQSLEVLINRVHGIAVGNPGGRPLVVFFDTRCGYCAQLWQTLQAHQQMLAMHWVPVALLSPASEHEALAMLASPDPAAALVQHMQRFGRAPGPQASAPSASDALREALAANRTVLSEVGERESVPQSVAQGEKALLVAAGAQPWPALSRRLEL